MCPATNSYENQVLEVYGNEEQMRALLFSNAPHVVVFRNTWTVLEKQGKVDAYFGLQCRRWYLLWTADGMKRTRDGSAKLNYAQ